MPIKRSTRMLRQFKDEDVLLRLPSRRGPSIKSLGIEALQSSYIAIRVNGRVRWTLKQSVGHHAWSLLLTAWSIDDRNPGREAMCRCALREAAKIAGGKK